MSATQTAEDLPLVCVMHTDEAKLMSAAIRIARQAVVADIECNANRTKLDEAVWWDTRPMLDPREHAPESLDMALQALDFAVLSGLAVRHQDKPYLLRITTEGLAV
jgi:hypothetical protein